MGFVERLRKADQLLSEYIKEAERIGRVLSRVLSKTLGVKIDYRLGDEETGPDFIWLICDDEEYWHRVRAYPISQKCYFLHEAIEEVFPEVLELGIYFDSYVHVSPEEYERVKEALRKLRGKEG